MNFFPLCTASVWPTISGVIIERRDQVLWTFFSFAAFIRSMTFKRCASMNGPFLTERAISFQVSGFRFQVSGFRFQVLTPGAWRLYFVLRLTMNLSVRLLLRVLYPRVGCPHGVTGLRPPEVLPSPPPCGWSTGFIATPRLCDRRPFQRERPALPNETFSCSMFPTWPTVALQTSGTRRTSPDGMRNCAYSPSFATNCANVPAERAICPPLPGRSSIL